MSTEATIGAILGVLGFLFTIATIVYKAGRLSSQIDSFCSRLDAHVAADEKKFELLFQADADQSRDMSDLRITLGAERRHNCHGAHGE